MHVSQELGTIGAPRASSRPGPAMRFIAGGSFTMGSERFYPEEAPLRPVAVDSFWIDETPVTNRDFAEFVAATGHVTLAEIAPDPRDYPGMKPELAHPGSLVFRKPAPGSPADGQWWHFVLGADWRHPLGPDSSLDWLDDHPVVQVAYADADAYARWAGKQLPSEAEWEYAARGGLELKEFAWGDDLAPEGAMLANYWQGRFPMVNTVLDGWERTSPVASFLANGHGLYDMIGNVWEWTADWWTLPGHPARGKVKRAGGKSCCTPIRNPRGSTLKNSLDPAMPEIRIGRKVLKGGSHLCAENYCQRYRPAARHPEMIDSATTHIGFRCIRRGQ